MVVGAPESFGFQSFITQAGTERPLIYLASIEKWPQELLCNILLNSVFHPPLMKGVCFMLLPIHHSLDTCSLRQLFLKSELTFSCNPALLSSLLKPIIPQTKQSNMSAGTCEHMMWV